MNIFLERSCPPFITRLKLRHTLKLLLHLDTTAARQRMDVGTDFGFVRSTFYLELITLIRRWRRGSERENGLPVVSGRLARANPSIFRLVYAGLLDSAFALARVKGSAGT